MTHLIGRGRYAAEAYPAPVRSNASFLAQPEWFINAVTGNDRNNGATSGTALASWAELARRWGPDPLLPQTTDVFIETDLAEPIFVRGTLWLTGTDVLRVTGAITSTLHSGSITAKTDLDPASQQPSVITDAAVGDWDTAGPGGTSLIGHRIRLTSGANVGAVAWLAKRTAATVARTSPFGTTAPTTTVTLVDPSVTDAYVVEQLTTVDGVNFNAARGTRNVAGAGLDDVLVVFDGIDVPRSWAVTFALAGSSMFLFARSRIGAAQRVGGICTYTLCGVSNVNVWGVVFLNAKACLWDAVVRNRLDVRWGANISLGSETLLQGIGVRCFAATLEGDGFAVFDAPAAAIQLLASAIASEMGLVWGTGNTGVGIDCRSGAKYVYNTKPIITGVAGDTEVGSLGVTAYAAIPVFDGGATGTGAAIVLDV